MIRVEFSGADFTGFVKEIGTELRPRMERACLAGVLVLHGAVKRKLSIQGTGKLYRRGKKGTRSHQASQPGQPPALDTGRLRNSIAFTQPVWEGDTVSAEVGTNVEYARIHEYGGRTGRNHAVRLPPRPYFRPAMEEAAPAIEKAMRDALG